MTTTPHNVDRGDRRCRDLFDAVVDLPLDQRERFLHDQIADDEVRRDVRSLLKYHDTLTSHDEPHQSLPEDRLLGHEIGGCHVIRRIGTGGMGIVYEAEQKHPHRRACSVIPATQQPGTPWAKRART